MEKLRRVLCLVLCLALLFAWVTGAGAAPRVTATPNPNPEATLPPDVTPYDANHPEKLLTEQLYAWSAILIEAESGRVIFEKNPDDIRYPASTTKIMTCLLALMFMDEADLNGTVVCSEQAVAVNTQEEDVTSLKLQPGEELNFMDLLEATMVYSANDGANVIAEAVAGSIPAFVDLMNEAAMRFGMTNTHFANAHGLHDDAHYTTPRDLATLTRIAMQNEKFRSIARMEYKTIPATAFHRERTVKTTNELFNPGTAESENRYYYPDAIGVKTGYEGKAQYCFVGAAERDGVTLISVVMYTGKRARWADTIKLMDYGFSQYTSVTPIELYNMSPITVETSNYSLKDSQLGKLPLRCVATDADSRAARIIATREEVDAMASSLRDTMLIQYTRDFIAPIEEGEVMGTMTYVDDSGSPVVYNLIAGRDIPRRETTPKTLAEIEAESDADPNFLPPLTPEVVFMALLPLGLALLIYFGLLRLLRRRKRHGGKGPEITQRYLR